MVSKKERCKINLLIEILKDTGELTTSELTTKADNMALSIFQNIYRPALKDSGCVEYDKSSRKWRYKWELIHVQEEVDSQKSMEDWIKNNN